MSDDGDPALVVSSPLQCKIFLATFLEVEHQVNTWIRQHPNIYIEQQETTNSSRGFAVTIWYTEDTTENKNAHFCEHGRLWFECSKCAKLDDLQKESE